MAEYDAFVFGSAVRFGKLHPAVLKFLTKHADTLKDMPMSAFVVCLTMKEDTAENRATVEAYLDPVTDAVPELNLHAPGLFAGRMNYKELPFLARTIARGVKALEGDFRRWNEISTWAKDLASALTG